MAAALRRRSEKYAQTGTDCNPCPRRNRAPGPKGSHNLTILLKYGTPALPSGCPGPQQDNNQKRDIHDRYLLCGGMPDRVRLPA